MSNLHTNNSPPNENNATTTRHRLLIVVVICAAAACAILAAAIASLPDRSTAAGDLAPANRSSPKAKREGGRARQQDRGDRPAVVADDGMALWESPTAGPPLQLGYLPPGTQCVVSLQLAALTQHAESDKLRAALGPAGGRAIQSIEQACRMPIERMEQLLVGWQPTVDGTWRATYVVHGKANEIRNAVSGTHGTAEHGEQEMYRLAEGRAYFVPPAGDGQMLVVAPADSIEEIIAMDGEAPPMPRDIERLLPHTDSVRDVTLLVTPSSLFSESRAPDGGPSMGRLRKALDWFLGDEFSAATVSMDWGDDFFIEIACVPTLETPPDQAARLLLDRVNQFPLRLEQYVNRLDAQPYGRQLVARLPAMVAVLAKYTRSSFGRGYAVARAYLPAKAGHNLLLAAELTLAVQPAGAPTALSGVNSRPAERPEAVAQRLDRITSIQFARDTLEAALEQLSREIGVAIVIRGTDLQAEGITKNQSFGIDLRDKPAGEILVEILRLANPDKTATNMADSRQKLVYVVEELGHGRADQIIVTTRAAAARRGHDLPPVFRSEPP